MHAVPVAIVVTLALGPVPTAAAQSDETVATRLAGLALECVHREYPNKIAHVLSDDGDARPPRELTPAFYGCYDWHSSVHGHWLLARLARLYPGAETAAASRTALTQSLTAENLRAEVDATRSSGRTGWRGCCSSPPSYASGTIPTRGAGGTPSPRSRRLPQRGFESGCRS